MSDRLPSIAWVSFSNDAKHGSVRSRVYWPHEYLCSIGCHSEVINDPTLELLDSFDVVLFHRQESLVEECVKMGKVVGLDVSDCFDVTTYPTFITTDSCANARMYAGVNTFYWPHGFRMRGCSEQHPLGCDDGVRFVYCGYPENVSCVHGNPFAAFVNIRDRSQVDLTVITDLVILGESGVKRLPGVSYVDWCVDTFEHIMMNQFHVGFFPQGDASYYQRKSAYKAMHAASLGLPSILTANEEASVVFTDEENALLVTDEKSWERAILLMLDTDCRHQLAERARTLIREQYSVRNMVQRLFVMISLYM